MDKRSAIVIGAGIVGLATARALALKGFSVTVFERTGRATGASIRNFGMVWPIGQPAGVMYDRAMRSRSIWQELGSAGVCWYKPAGSLHLAYHNDEWEVLQELQQSFGRERGTELLTAPQVAKLSGSVVQQGLIGGLYSRNELIVDPREAIWAIPHWLEKTYDIRFRFDTCIHHVTTNVAYAGQEKYEADLICICTGADFETLYPGIYASLPLTKCKLQMMRLAAQPNHEEIGPALCGGLSLIHYKSFTVAGSLQKLKQRYEQEMAAYLRWGIHVMVCQNGRGELTVGDSHEYGPAPDPFDRAFINEMVLDYLKKFAQFRNEDVIETWNGVYAKLTDGRTEICLSPETGVHIINGLSGAGMTLSFGLAEEAINALVG